MKLPKMIMFDYHLTLVAEPEPDSLRGNIAVMRHAIRNPQNLTSEQIEKFATELFANVCIKAREIGVEIHETQFQWLLYEYPQIEFDVPLTEIERIYWDNVSHGAAMPYVNEMLLYLEKRGIRTGVISNLGFSGSALSDRLKSLLPNNRFEFVIASSEYGVRKPNPILFELALHKAKLNACDVWFCGDNPLADVDGACSAGIFPVWYEDLTINRKTAKPPACEHLHIHDWRELSEILNRLRDE